MAQKKKAKRKKETVDSPSEVAFVNALIKEVENLTPSEIISRISSPNIARIFIERLPLESKAFLSLLVALDSYFKEKSVKKAIKRALFRLDKAGVEIREFYEQSQEIKGPVVLNTAYREDPFAYLGPIGMKGYRSFLVVMPRGADGQDIGIGIISDEEGIHQFVSGKFSKKRIKEMKEGLSKEAGPLIETSLSHAASVLEQAYSCQPEFKSDAASNYLDFRPRLLEKTSPIERPIIYDFMTENSPDRLLTYSQVKKLFDHSLMESWLIDPEELRPFIEEIVNLEESPIVLSRAQKSDQAAKIKEKGLLSLFPLSRQGLLKNRLEEMAYYFLRTSQEEYAGLSFAASLSLGEEGPVQKSQVIEFLFDRSIAFYMNSVRENSETGAKKKESQPKKIIIP